jgi:hypothetical protein
MQNRRSITAGGMKNLYNAGKFEFIDDNLNFVTNEFINSQLRNAAKKPTDCL